MKKYICVVLLLLSITLSAQPLRDINYTYLYSPDQLISFRMEAIRSEGVFTILYSLQVKDTTAFAKTYAIEWEGRASLSDKTGTVLSLNVIENIKTKSGVEGRTVLQPSEAPRFVIARVRNFTMNRVWLFYTELSPAEPENTYLLRNGSPVLERFIRVNEQVSIGKDSAPWVISFYDDNFPAAAPAFSEGLARVSARIESDSTFQAQGDQPITFSKKGLYLIQKDTSALEALSFRVEEDYPQYTKFINLAGPLVYISTKQEFDRLQLANGNKKAFDRIVLNMVSDTERARTLMRSYFKRVELANHYFTSYKEGWKTDRGMIYIIFGVPEEVFRFDNREVWTYDNDVLKGSFTFSRSSSLFDPDNFVLIRDEKHKEQWYEVVDLWRNARF